MISFFLDNIITKVTYTVTVTSVPSNQLKSSRVGRGGFEEFIICRREIVETFSMIASACNNAIKPPSSPVQDTTLGLQPRVIFVDVILVN